MITQAKISHAVESNYSMIYPIYQGKSICKKIVAALGYDPLEDVDQSYGAITFLNTMGKLPFKMIYFIGLGKEEEINPTTMLNAFGKIVKTVKEENLLADLHHADTANISAQEIAALFTEAALLASYNFTKVGKAPEKEKTFELLSNDSIESVIEQTVVVANAINHTRTLGNMPSNLMTPVILAEYASKLAKECSLESTILTNKELEEIGAGALLAVNQGSEEEARLIVLKYNGAGDEPYTALIGKGLTFDSGGYNLKPSASMTGMKFDMCGGATVLGAIEVIAKLKLKANVYAIVPSTENMISGEGFKCDDVVTSLSKKTIEITNTDAEGRLILCDAITYATQLGAKKIIDIATLTGACVVALGDVYTGAFSNNDSFYNKFHAVSKEVNEKVWRMPLDDGYAKQLVTTSTVADLINSGGRMGGASVAAEFLHQFVEDDIEWIHLDVAGTASSTKANDLNPVGATGVMVKSLAKLFK